MSPVRCLLASAHFILIISTRTREWKPRPSCMSPRWLMTLQVIWRVLKSMIVQPVIPFITSCRSPHRHRRLFAVCLRAAWLLRYHTVGLQESCRAMSGLPDCSGIILWACKNRAEQWATDWPAEGKPFTLRSQNNREMPCIFIAMKIDKNDWDNVTLSECGNWIIL
jgi:hypothetical protein